MIKRRTEYDNIKLYTYMQEGVAHAELDINDFNTSKLKLNANGVCINIKLSQIDKSKKDILPENLHIRLREELSEEQMHKIKFNKDISIMLSGIDIMPTNSNIRIKASVCIPSKLLH